MKKILTYIFMFSLLFTVNIIGVNAIDLGLSTNNAIINEKTDTTVEIKLLNNIEGPKLYAIGGVLTFDSNYLSFVSCTGTSATTKVTVTDVGVGKKGIKIETTPGTKISTAATLATVVFKGISQVETTNLNFVGTEVWDLSADSTEEKPMPGQPAKISDKSNLLGITVNKVKSENNNLKTLTLKNAAKENVVFTPQFNPNTLTYTALVPFDVDNLVISAETEDTSSKLSGIGSVKLKPDVKNTFPITVTSEKGIHKVYNVEVTIMPEIKINNAELESLEIKEVKDFKFESTKTVYTLSVDKKIDKLELEYKTIDEKAIVEVKGNKDLEDGSEIRIIVTAVDEKTKKTYVLKIKKNVTTTKKQEEIIKKKENKRNPFIVGGLGTIALGLFGALLYVIKKEE